MEREIRTRRLLDENSEFVCRTLRRFGIYGPDTEDAAQEVFVVAARRLENIAIGSERCFLFGTAYRVAATRRRTRRRRPEEPHGGLFEEHDERPGPDYLTELIRARQLFQRALATMSHEQSAVLKLCDLEGLSGPEIAQFLGVPLSTVNARLRQARQALELFLKRVRARETFAHREQGVARLSDRDGTRGCTG